MKQGMKKDEGIRIITYCLFGNLVLFILKGTIGLLVGSQVLKADAVNSAGDAMSSIVVLLGLRYALKPHDEDHHYGHGKMEALVSLLVGVTILIGIGFLLRDIVLAIQYSDLTSPSFFALGAAVLSIIIKVLMYKKTSEAANRLFSIALMTSAKDHKNDIYATSGAIAAIILALLGQRFGVEILLIYAEPVIAGLMSLLIIKSAIEIIGEASKMLLDAAPDKETMGSIKTIVSESSGVEKLNWVKCRKMGRGLLVDVAIEVVGAISVEQGHEIGDDVKFAIMAKFPDVIDVMVHINPNRD